MGRGILPVIDILISLAVILLLRKRLFNLCTYDYWEYLLLSALDSILTVCSWQYTTCLQQENCNFFSTSLVGDATFAVWQRTSHFEFLFLLKLALLNQFFQKLPKDTKTADIQALEPPRDIQRGAAGWVKRFVKKFLRVPHALLGQHGSCSTGPTASATLRKMFTK